MVLAVEDACPNGLEVEVEPPPDAGGTGEAGGTEEGVVGSREGAAAEPTEGANTSGAMQQVLDNLGELPTSTGAKDIDLIFLRGIMESPIVRSLSKAHERLEDLRLEAVQDNNIELVTDILGDITALAVRDDSAAELSRILQEPHFQLQSCLIAATPAWTRERRRSRAMRPLKHNPTKKHSFLTQCPLNSDNAGPIVHHPMVAAGCNRAWTQTREAHQDIFYLQAAMFVGFISSKAVRLVGVFEGEPSPQSEVLSSLEQVFIKSLAAEKWKKRRPKKVLALGMTSEIYLLELYLQRLIDDLEPACHVVGGATGLIPSQFLEEKRKAFVPRDVDGSGILCGTITGKKKKKMMYLTARNAEFDRHELQIYEEVAKMPPFQRKTLVLIGAQGVGRRSLKNRLVVLNPTCFGTTIPFTSRRPRDDELDGKSYRFVTRTEMEADVKAGGYLEHGEYDGNLYGTKMDSIHEVVDTGRTCILDVNPQALKVLKTAEFMPYVVFIAAPEFETLKAMHKATVDAGITTKQLTDVDLRKTVDESARIQRTYNHYFDLAITNDNLDRAFQTLQAAVDKLCSEPQWVPVNWVY
ncbi:protein PALS2 [Salvelinus sp. IW2-2015]|uniref:protein PALS2 n=1 Tax=Salvelinus sp. IW2-2015 TaxID=2691554 RepID=UPI0038D4ED1D